MQNLKIKKSEFVFLAAFLFLVPTAQAQNQCSSEDRWDAATKQCVSDSPTSNSAVSRSNDSRTSTDMDASSSIYKKDASETSLLLDEKNDPKSSTGAVTNVHSSDSSFRGADGSLNSGTKSIAAKKGSLTSY